MHGEPCHLAVRCQVAPGQSSLQQKVATGKWEFGLAVAVRDSVEVSLSRICMRLYHALVVDDTDIGCPAAAAERLFAPRKDKFCSSFRTPWVEILRF